MAKINDPLFKTVLIAALLLILLGYTLFQARRILTGPQVVILYPEDGSLFYERLVEINGQTKNINAISMNGLPIFIDDEGYFNERLLLSEGYNIIKIEAKDRFGKLTEEYLRIVYEKLPGEDESSIEEDEEDLLIRNGEEVLEEVPN